MSRQRIRLLSLMLPLLVLSVLLASCAFPGVYTSAEQLPPVKREQKPVQLPPVRFPQDEAPHRNLTEWWYYTGHFNATDTSGKIHRYGFEFVIFQALRSDLPAVYPSHFAITDLTRDEFHYAQRRILEANAVIPNGTSTAGIDIRVQDWTIKGLNGRDQLHATMPDYAIDFNLQAAKPPALHNGNGLITYGLGGFSYYYSRTNMAVSGTILDHNQPLKVSGQAWMDHQWGDFLTLGGGGWDWYSIQLQNKTELMIYFIRDASGKTISTYVGYIDARGKDSTLPEKSIGLTVLERWTSPTTGITYPSGWRLEINDPQLKTTLTIKPKLKNQELVVYESTGNTYWEGAVDIESRSSGTTITGQGYVELTGYAKA